MLSPGSPLKLRAIIGTNMRGWCGVMRLDAAGSSCCDGSSWGSAGASSKGFSRVSESETESASELSVDGVDVPVDSISMPVDEGVMLITRWRGRRYLWQRGSAAW